MTLEPSADSIPQLSTCAYGDPDAPKVLDRPLSNIATVAVMTGDSSYHAGAVQAAKDAFALFRGNAADIEPVAGIGEDAYWTGGRLSVLSGAYIIDVEVDGDSREMAETIARRALAKLP